MRINAKHAILGACFNTLARAGPAAIASPGVTPAPLLPRDNIKTLGWMSESLIGNETTYTPYSYDGDIYTYITSGIYFQPCSSTPCQIWTGCSEGYIMGVRTSSSCGAGGAASSYFCSNDVLYKSLGATREYSWYWCDTAPNIGTTYYEEEPPQPTRASSPISTDASTTATESSVPSTSPITGTSTGPTSDPTSTPSSEPKSSVSTGAIAGGVLGGLVAIAAICGGILFFLRRKKKQNTAYAPVGDSSFNPSYNDLTELKPAGAPIGTYNTATAFYTPQAPYDPHMSMGYAPSVELPAEPAGIPQQISELAGGSVVVPAIPPPVAPPAVASSSGPPVELPTRRMTGL